MDVPSAEALGIAGWLLEVLRWWRRMVVWLVGAGLKPAPTGWLAGCLSGSPAVGEGGWEGVDDAGGLDGGVGDAFNHGDDVGGSSSELGFMGFGVGWTFRPLKRLGGGLVGGGRFETCPYGLVGGRVASMEMWVFGRVGWHVVLLLPNWAGGSGWLNDN